MTSLELTAVQTSHAKVIVAVCKHNVEIYRHLDADHAARAADIALQTALVESSLLIYANPAVPGSMALPHDAVGHDHASVGVFQQQVPGWGLVADCQRVDTSCRKFLHRLFEFDWHGRSNWELAQLVQVSAFPERYQARDAQAIRIRRALW